MTPNLNLEVMLRDDDPISVEYRYQSPARFRKKPTVQVLEMIVSPDVAFPAALIFFGLLEVEVYEN